MGILFKSKKGHELHAIGGLSEKPLYRGSLMVIQRKTMKSNKTFIGRKFVSDEEWDSKQE
jgi:hypothetical protein